MPCLDPSAVGDILVNNAFALPEDLTESKPFWEKPLSNWEMVNVGVRSNFAAARHAAQIMVPQGSGLIVATSGYVGVTYTYGVVFGLCKAAVDRMARDMAIELQPHNVASVSLWQGLTMTERAQRNLAARPEMTQSVVTSPAVGCSPEFPGRVIAALATDPDLMNLSGGTWRVQHAAGKQRPALEPRGRQHRSESGIRSAGVPRLAEAVADPGRRLFPRPVDLVGDQVDDPGQLGQRGDRTVVG